MSTVVKSHIIVFKDEFGCLLHCTEGDSIFAQA